MYGELLQEIGLSPNEAKVYEALISIGETSVQEVALKAKVHRRNVYDSLARLVDKGLVSELFVKGEKHFKAMSPQRLLELLKEKEEQVNEALPGMQAAFQAVEARDEAYFYRGIEGFKNYLQSILEQGEDVYFMGAKAFWLDPRLRHYLARFEKERKRKGITFYHIFDQEVKTKKPEILELVGKPYKFLPAGYSSQTAIDIFGDFVVTFVGVKLGELAEEPLQFVLKSRRLADGYRKFWQFMWDNIADE